jgi:hypothetical protein
LEPSPSPRVKDQYGSCSTSKICLTDISNIITHILSCYKWFNSIFKSDWTKIHNLRKDFNFTWNNGSNPNSDDDELIIDGYTKVGIGVTDKYIQPINQIKDSSIVLPLALQVCQFIVCFFARA